MNKTATECNICQTPLVGKPFVDGKTLMGPWADMCLTCHKRAGVGLGTGRGQKYDENGKKVEG